MTFVNSAFYLGSDKLFLFENCNREKGKGREAKCSLWTRKQRYIVERTQALQTGFNS